MSRFTPTFLRTSLMLLLALIPVSIAAQVDESASPASGHAQVVAQGVATLPDGQIVWQVETLAAGNETPVQLTGPAFIVTTDAGVLVSEPARQRDVRLAPGEAHFLHAEVAADVWSLGEAEATFQAWSLAPESETSADASFVSDPFGAPAGARDLNLVRDVLSPDEATQIDNGDAFALILATGAAATAVNAAGEAVELAVDTPAVQTGPFSITVTGSDPATVVVGLIGPSVSLPTAEDPGADEPDATPEATSPDGGAIRLVTYTCPAEVDLAAATPETCSDDGFGSGQWTLYGGSLEGPASPALEGGVWIWQGLGAGNYRIVLDVFPDAYERFAIDLYDYAGRDGSEINVTVADDLPNLFINAYFLDPQEPEGEPLGESSLGLLFYECPPETTTDTLVDAADAGCAIRDTPFPMALTSAELPAELTSAVLLRVTGSAADESQWQWSELPAGEYTLTIAEQEPGDSFYVQRPCVAEPCPDTGGLGSSFDVVLDDDGATLIIYRIPES